MDNKTAIDSSLVHAFDSPADKRIEVLRKIAQTGSISKAARVCEISYKAAWQAVDTLTNLTGMSLVEKTVGGAGGGGAIVTPAGMKLLEIADTLMQKRAQVLGAFQMKSQDKLNARLTNLSIQTSMRNYLPCTVKGVKMNGQIVRICLLIHEQLPMLVARITRTSAELLDLKIGMEVLAMCKATAVKIVKEQTVDNFSVANQFHGDVTRISEGNDEDEVTIELLPGLQLVGFAKSDQRASQGKPVYASVEESAVVIALLP